MPGRPPPPWRPSSRSSCSPARSPTALPACIPCPGGAEHAGPAVGQAVHHSDGRLGAGADLVAAAGAHGVPVIQLRLRVPAVVLALLVNVSAGREGAVPRPRDDDAADL